MLSLGNYILVWLAMDLVGHVDNFSLSVQELFDGCQTDLANTRCAAMGPITWPYCLLLLFAHLSGLPHDVASNFVQDMQLSFFRNFCQLRRSVMPHIILREFAERPWLDSW